MDWPSTPTRLLLESPETRSQQDQNREQLQPSQEHQEAEQQLAGWLKVGIRFRDTNTAQTRAHPVQGGGHTAGTVHEFFMGISRRSGPGCLGLNCQQKQPRYRCNEQKRGEVEDHVANDRRLDRLSVDTKWPNDPRPISLFRLQRQCLNENQVPNDLDAATGAAGASADEHEEEQQTPPEFIPSVEIVGPEARIGEHQLKPTIARASLRNIRLPAFRPERNSVKPRNTETVMEASNARMAFHSVEGVPLQTGSAHGRLSAMEAPISSETTPRLLAIRAEFIDRLTGRQIGDRQPKQARISIVTTLRPNAGFNPLNVVQFPNIPSSLDTILTSSRPHLMHP